MAVGHIDAIGIVTNYHLSIPENEWYTTQETDEIISLVDNYNLLRNVNTITIFANGTDLVVSLCLVDNETDENERYESDKIFISAGSILEQGNIKFNARKVYGASGQQIKYI